MKAVMGWLADALGWLGEKCADASDWFNERSL